MKKIGKISFSIFLFFHLTILSVYSQDVQFISKASKYKISRFEEIELTFSINGQGTSFKEPKNLRENFIVISGPNNNTFTRFDGSSLYIENSITFLVMPKKAGRFTIDEASITVGGKSYKSKPIQIEVTNAPLEENNNPNDPKNIAKKLAFVKVKVPKNTFYQGEGFTVDYLLYYKTNIMNVEIINEPSFRGFYAEVIKDEISPYQESVNGEMYNVVTLKRYHVISQKSGKFDLGSLEVRIPTEISTGQRDFFNPFFRSSTVVNQVSVSSVPSITVRSLPEYKGLYEFTGAVGTFDFKAKLTRKDVKVGEATSLHVTAEGVGNVKMINFSNLTFPKQLDVFEPKYTEKYTITKKGMSGNKSVEYIIIPKYNGTYKIPKIAFVYFDPSSAKYIEVIADDFEINASGGQAYSSSNEKDVSTANQKVPTSYINKDILFIKTTFSWLPSSRYANNAFIITWWFTVFLATIALVIFYQRILMHYFKSSQRMRGYKKSIAQIVLDADNTSLDSKEKLHFLNKKFHEVLSEKFDCNMGGISERKRILENTPLKDFADELADIFIETEEALYALKSDEEIQKIYSKYKNILSLISK